jgi:signal transduction histidine kinase
MAAFLFAALGLLALDQMLDATRRADAERAAAEAAAFVGGFLDVHVQALQSLRALYAGGQREVSDRDFQGLMDVLEQHQPLFRRVWLTDSAGIIRHQRLFGPSDSRFVVGVDVDTIETLKTREFASLARRTHSTQISNTGVLTGQDQGFVVLEPIYVGDEFAGFAGGTITGDAVLESIGNLPGSGRFTRVVMAADQTVTTDTQNSELFGLTHTVETDVRTPDGSPWRVIILYDAAEPARLALWAVGLIMLLTLGIAFFHDRRQAVRLAARTEELERLSSELIRANRSKSEFLANVSHELRTPLNAVVGFVDMLRDGVYGELPPRQVNPINRIASSSTHLRHLVDQVLDIAKLAAGRMEFQPEPVDISALVQDVLSECEALLNENNLLLQLEVPGNLPRAKTDRVHLRQILLNLIGNAIKYTREGGISVKVRRVDALGAPRHLVGHMPPSPITGELSTMPPASQWVAIDVTDSGIGIDPADFERIFEEFEQVNAGSRGESIVRGTGLGLAISRRLARLIGGDVTVSSEVGRGSTFTVWLAVDG